MGYALVLLLSMNPLRMMVAWLMVMSVVMLVMVMAMMVMHAESHDDDEYIVNPGRWRR